MAAEAGDKPHHAKPSISALMARLVGTSHPLKLAAMSIEEGYLRRSFCSSSVVGRAAQSATKASSIDRATSRDYDAILRR